MAFTEFEEVMFSNLPRPAKLIYGAMAVLVDSDHESYAGIERISAWSGFGAKTVKRHRKRLVDAGLLELVEQGGRGGFDPNCYKMTFQIADPEPLTEMDGQWNYCGEPSVAAQALAKRTKLRCLPRKAKNQSLTMGGSQVTPPPKSGRNWGGHSCQGGGHSGPLGGSQVTPNKKHKNNKKTRGRASEPQAARTPSLTDDPPELPVFRGPIGNNLSDLGELEIVSQALSTEKPIRQDDESQREWAQRWLRLIKTDAGVLLEGNQELPPGVTTFLHRWAPSVFENTEVA